MPVVPRLCLAALACVPLCSHVGAQELNLTLTEDQAIMQFMERSPDVRALRHRVAEQAQQNQARTLLANPMLWYTQESAAGVRDDFLQFRQPIPLTGRRRLFDKANRDATASVEATVDYEIHQLRAAIRSVFTSLLRAQQREQAVGESLQEIGETVRVLTAREREGDGSRFDRLRGERELEELRATLAGETIARARARSELAGRIGIAGSTESLVATPTSDPDLTLPPVAQLVDQALASRADLRAESSRLASVDAEHEAGRRLRFPQPSVTGGLKRTDVGGIADTGYTLGVELTLPLSNRGQAETARTKATSVRVRADQEALRLRIAREVRTAYQVATLSRQRAQNYVAGTGVSGEALALIARLAYEEGEQGILELIDAHRVTLSTRLRGIDLLADARQARVELDRVVGHEVSR